MRRSETLSEFEREALEAAMQARILAAQAFERRQVEAQAMVEPYAEQLKDASGRYTRLLLGSVQRKGGNPKAVTKAHMALDKSGQPTGALEWDERDDKPADAA